MTPEGLGRPSTTSNIAGRIRLREGVEGVCSDLDGHKHTWKTRDMAKMTNKTMRRSTTENRDYVRNRVYCRTAARKGIRKLERLFCGETRYCRDWAVTTYVKSLTRPSTSWFAWGTVNSPHFPASIVRFPLGDSKVRTCLTYGMSSSSAVDPNENVLTVEQRPATGRCVDRGGLTWHQGA